MNLMKLSSCRLPRRLGGRAAGRHGRPRSATPRASSASPAAPTARSGGSCGRAQRAKAEELAPQGGRGYFPGRLYVELQRHPEGDGLPEAERPDRARLGRAGLRAGPAAGRHQRRPLPQGGALRGARRADVHRRRRLRGPAGAAPAPDARSTTSSRRRRWRRSSPTSPRRWRTPSRSPAAAPSRCPKRAPILPRFADDEVEELRRQAQGGPRRPPRRDPPRRAGRGPTRSASPSSSASSSRWASRATS